MSRYRAEGATDPAKLALGFGNPSVSAITRRIAAIADLLTGDRHHLPDK